MQYRIKNSPFLRKILWLDALMGSSTAIVGLIFFNWLTDFLGLSSNFIKIVSAITLLYAFFALFLAIQKNTPIPLLRLLVNANWIWAIISVFLLFIHAHQATNFGVIFLILQIFIVGGLAYLEEKQILKVKN
jgi:hypothetical protein